MQCFRLCGLCCGRRLGIDRGYNGSLEQGNGNSRYHNIYRIWHLSERRWWSKLVVHTVLVIITCQKTCITGYAQRRAKRIEEADPADRPVIAESVMDDVRRDSSMFRRLKAFWRWALLCLSRMFLYDMMWGRNVFASVVCVAEGVWVLGAAIMVV